MHYLVDKAGSQDFIISVNRNPEFMIESTATPRKWDRLAAFFSVFPLAVKVTQGDFTAVGSPAMFLYGDNCGITHVALTLRRDRALLPSPSPLPIAAAEVDFGGLGNPLLNALPDTLQLNTQNHPALQATALAFLLEARADRCGSSRALDRLGEVLVLLVLRSAIEAGAEVPGLLAGLAHPDLHRVLVAMHEAPSRAWNVESLADIGSMSRSRFMGLFRSVVGMPPMAYLNRWRLVVGRRALLQEGVKVKVVAKRSGFGSPEAFSRAFKKEFGSSPTDTATERI